MIKPVFLLGTQPTGEPVALNANSIQAVVAGIEPAITMVFLSDGSKVAITETVAEFIESVDNL